MSEAHLTGAPKPARRNAAAGGDTVTVACSLPNGLMIQVYDVEEIESVLPNGRVVKENVSTLNYAAGQVQLNGTAIDYAALAAGQVPDYRVIKGAVLGTGYALTPGVPRSLWEHWLHQNASSPLVLNRIVFAAGTEARAADEAREYKDLRSGFQGLNPAGDPRVPSGRSIRKYNPSDNRVTPEQAELSAE